MKYSPLLTLAFVAFGAAASADSFTYDPPGQLVPTSGNGRKDQGEYAPGIRHPMEHAPAFANSQVWGVGGNSGPSGSQCDDRNYSYPWHDNYCETRDYAMRLCPSGKGHQGQDIRPGTCADRTHWVLAVADGTITSVGSYSVYLTTGEGTRFDYLHMDDLQIKKGQVVKRGARLGKVSNVFYSNGARVPTTWHLHFNIYQNVNGEMVYAPPYMSLVRAYERLLADEDAGVPVVTPSDSGTTIEIPDSGTQVIAPEAGTTVNLLDANPDEGCGCNAAPTGTSVASGLALFGTVVAFVRRRRNRR